MSVLSSFKPNPILAVSAPLLLFLSKAPPSIQAKILPTSLSRGGIVKVLAISVTIGVISQVNKILSAWALNNWLWSSGRGDALGVNGWDKEIAVIAGGSGGIGVLVAQKLAAKGAKVAIIDVVEPETDHNNINYFSCDLTSPKAVKEVSSAVSSFLGPPTILINSAGIIYAHNILETSPIELRKIFEVNIISHYYTIQAFLPSMIQRKRGHIVALASLAGLVGVPSMADYCATKSGLIGFYEGLVQELKYRYDAPEIKTSVICPTYVNTQLISPYIGSLKELGSLILEPAHVSDAIVDSICKGQSGQILVPKFLSFLSKLRALPIWFQQSFRDSLKNDIKSSICKAETT